MSPVTSNVHDSMWNGRNEHGRQSHGSPKYMSWTKLIVGLLILLGVAAAAYFPFFRVRSGILYHYNGMVSSVTLPEQVHTVNRWAFLGEGELVEIIVPGTVQELGKEAFAECSKLERLYIPASVTKIGMLLLRGSDQAVIFCERDSCAHRYAETWSYPYELID